MNDIRFICPQCGQLLSVDPNAADTTVTCPKCGQAIMVPQMSRMIARSEKPKTMKWALIVASAGGITLLAAGGLIWQMHRRPVTQAGTPVSASIVSNPIASAQEVRPSDKSPSAASEEISPSVAAGENNSAITETAAGLGPSIDRRAPLSDWFVVLDDSTNGFYASVGVPQAAIKALNEAKQEKVELNSFAFTPAGDWVLLDDNGFKTSSETVPGYSHFKGDTECVAFSPGGPWIILYRNGFWGPGSAAWLKVKELRSNGHEIRSVAFGSGGGYVVLYDETGAAYSGIPNTLAQVLDNAASNNITIKSVAFSGRDWICLAQDSWWTSNPDLPAAKIIAQDFKIGIHPKWVALVPALGPFNPDKFAALLRTATAGKIAGGYECVVIDHGKVVVSLAEGWARAPWEKVNPGVKMTVSKIMTVASVSKTITAVAMLKLWEECTGTSRQFSLDEPFWPHIRNLCPNVNEGVKRVTFRQLLAHRSGFPDDPPWPCLDIPGLRKYLILPLAHPPGSVYKYQGLDYLILHFLIEQISGVDYTAHVKSHALAPMGITDMDTRYHDNPRMCFYAKPGTREPGDNDFCSYTRDNSSWAGSGGWYGSAMDMAEFLEGIRQYRVLSPTTAAMMFQQNLGWDWGSPLGPWGKGGLAAGSKGKRFCTGIIYCPDGVEIAMLANCDVNTEAIPVPIWKDARY